MPSQPLIVLRAPAALQNGFVGRRRRSTRPKSDTPMTPTLKAVIVQNLGSFSPLGGKGFTAWRQACSVQVQLEPLARFSLP